MQTISNKASKYKQPSTQTTEVKTENQSNQNNKTQIETQTNQ